MFIATELLLVFVSPFMGATDENITRLRSYQSFSFAACYKHFAALRLSN